MLDNTFDQKYWSQRYIDENTGWDIGEISTPLKTFFDQITDKSITILIPGCGNAYEAAYLWKNGFKNVFLMDLSPIPLKKFQEQHPDFPKDQLLEMNFFDCELQHHFDLIVEQTFFCALHPSLRADYAKKMNQLLSQKGELVGLLFDASLYQDHPPFGGSKKEYISILGQHLEIEKMEDSYNSIAPRQGRELFFIANKKQ
ncbi:MAG: TPMT family class I SAM-dependent methyltransferase [Cyclobacteriaceae bacterium]|nr:methyltransferase domain-containing protein [Cyclobacteriaceae bacterium]MCH8515373.1 TPMT family class I SAM-dependent methyltransferase [Cyclobacteriaceae bacterium]